MLSAKSLLWFITAKLRYRAKNLQPGTSSHVNDLAANFNPPKCSGTNNVLDIFSLVLYKSGFAFSRYRWCTHSFLSQIAVESIKYWQCCCPRISEYHVFDTCSPVADLWFFPFVVVPVISSVVNLLSVFVYILYISPLRKRRNQVSEINSDTEIRSD